MEFSFTQLMILFFVFMGIGVLFQLYIGTKTTKENKKSSWLKFIFFNIIISSLLLLLSISTHLITISYSIISLGGMIELLMVTQKNSGKLKIVSIVFYLFLFILFIPSSVCMDVSIHCNVLALVAVFDGFSQLGGKWIGKTKLAPTISPNKTWEGAIFGTIAAFCFGISLYFLGDQTIISYLFFLPLFALSGDLLASFIKRKAKVKDFSNLIPYQGGFLDRFDSLVFSIVGIYLLTNFI